jgi:hypothetical protein
MRRKLAGLLAVVALSIATEATAQADLVQEIVVTGARMDAFDPLRTPMVTLAKRADNLITTLTVSCDTRDESQRLSELKATLRNLIRAAAADQTIELGIGDEVIGRFDETMLDAVIAKTQKVDTSIAKVIIKTPVTAADTFDSATGRVERFAKAVPIVGRSEILLDDDWQLTVLGPNQYHTPIVQLIADNARRSATVFGDGYGVSVEGLQLPVSWYQSGPLDLALYIPYKMVVAPKP